MHGQSPTSTSGRNARPARSAMWDVEHTATVVPERVPAEATSRSALADRAAAA